MAVAQRLLFLGIVPLIIITFHVLYPSVFGNIQESLSSVSNVWRLTSVTPVAPLSRSETPLFISAVVHWSHFEKIAKVAVALANLGYPITLITGSIFEKESSNLHPRITFYPLQGGADKLTEEQYATYASLDPGSEEAELFIMKSVLVGGMPAGHDTLQKIFQDFQKQYGDSRPLLSFYDLPVTGHLPILLGAQGVKPDVTFGISCHPIVLDSIDTYPPYVDKMPDSGPNAWELHDRAYGERHNHFRTGQLDLAWWVKLREMGAIQTEYPSILHGMASLPDHLFTMGVPEFEWPRSDLRPNVHYFGGLRQPNATAPSKENLPSWWDEIAQAKKEGKKIVAISQGTVAADMQDLLIPSLEALKDREDVLIIVSTVVMEPDEVPGLVLPANARATKFVPYDLLLPSVSNITLSIVK